MKKKNIAIGTQWHLNVERIFFGIEFTFLFCEHLTSVHNMQCPYLAVCYDLHIWYIFTHTTFVSEILLNV